VKIARLAVDKRCQVQKLGAKLVELSLGISKDIICPHIGRKFAMVDSKQSAIPFYHKMRFTLLGTASNKDRNKPVMFIVLAKVP
jgi:Acetyltransferase (GNAT) domain